MAEKAAKIFIEDFIKKQRIRNTSPDPDDKAVLFSGLSEENIQRLLSNSHVRDFRAGQEILQQGDTPSHLYCIIRGGIRTLRYGAEGQEATIRMLKDGETFMDAVIFMGGQSPINVAAVEDSTLLMIPADTVRRHALHDAVFACNLLRIVTRHYKTAIQQIDSIVIKTPAERLGYYFLRLLLDQGSESMTVSLPFQKALIANHLGMTPETFSRALAQVRKMGIGVDQEKLTLQDAYALCHFCDPDTADACPKANKEGCRLCTSGRGKRCHHS
jgi:CRP-like cAMP-binding protein